MSDLDLLKDSIFPYNRFDLWRDVHFTNRYNFVKMGSNKLIYRVVRIRRYVIMIIRS